MSEGQIVVVDESKMLDAILDLPGQLEKTWTSLWVKAPPLPKLTLKNVIIAGMGGSGIAGQLASELFAEKSKLPLTTWADYGLPGWADETTLLIAVSCSGNTEETLDVVKQAQLRKVPIIAITTGGKLEELAGISGFPVIKFDFTGSPRAALGYLYGSLLTLLVKLGLIELEEKAYFQALEELKRSIAQRQFLTKAEELAVTLNNKIPVIMTYSPLTAVARRYQTQLNENSKTFAIATPLPESCHNFIVGLDFAVPEKLLVLLLESKFGFSRNIARQKILARWFTQKDVPMVPLSVKSGSALAEQFLFIHFGDLLSFYLAGVYGVDPTPIEAINFLKSELNKL